MNINAAFIKRREELRQAMDWWCNRLLNNQWHNEQGRVMKGIEFWRTINRTSIHNTKIN